MSETSADGIWFSHDCRDHGYDLADTETAFLAALYLSDPQRWRDDAARAAAVQAVAANAIARADRQRRFEELSTEFA